MFMVALGHGRGIVNSSLSFRHSSLRSAPKLLHASPLLAMPRSKKNKENPNLESVQPWDRPAAAVSRTEPKPKPVTVPVVRKPTNEPVHLDEPVLLTLTDDETPLLKPNDEHGHLKRKDGPVPLEPQDEPVVAGAKEAPAPTTKPVGLSTTVTPNTPTTRSQTVGRVVIASEFEIDALGRELTRILRHKATDYKLPIRGDGYVPVAELLKLNVTTRARDASNRGKKLSSYSETDVQKAVALDAKQRLGVVVVDDKLYIRANQGHTMKVIVSESLLTPVLDAREVPVCVHGTYRRHLQSIFAEGLSTMKRLHVHFATGLPNNTGVISGMRTSCEVLIHLDVEKALKAGMLLFRSENGVILTEGFMGVVPTEYFSRVESLPDRRAILIPTKLVK